MHKFQKFFCVFNRHEKTDCLVFRIFWSIVQKIMDQKMTGAKKVVVMKNQFFHASQPRDKILEFYSCWGLHD